jgi:hypothetical protein
MHTPIRHGNATLRRIGVGVIVVGLVAVVLPAPRAEPLADTHELIELMSRHLWWQFGGWAAVQMGCTLLLIGLQGHPGLPLPRLRGGPPPEIVARLELRRRAHENRVKARSLVPSAR